MTDIQLSPGAAGGEANDAFGVTAATISPRKMAFKRYVNHRGALVSTIVLAIIVIFVALAPITARYGVDEIIFKAEAGKPNSNLPPSSLAWFGTTSNGYDLYSRMIYGARVSLMIGLFTGLISVYRLQIVDYQAVGRVAGEQVTAEIGKPRSTFRLVIDANHICGRAADADCIK